MLTPYFSERDLTLLLQRSTARYRRESECKGHLVFASILVAYYFERHCKGKENSDAYLSCWEESNKGAFRVLDLGVLTLLRLGNSLPLELRIATAYRLRNIIQNEVYDYSSYPPAPAEYNRLISMLDSAYEEHIIEELSSLGNIINKEGNVLLSTCPSSSQEVSMAPLETLASQILANLADDTYISLEAKWQRGELYAQASEHFTSRPLFRKWIKEELLAATKSPARVELEVFNLMACVTYLEREQFLSLGYLCATELMVAPTIDKYPVLWKALLTYVLEESKSHKFIREAMKEVQAGTWSVPLKTEGTVPLPSFTSDSAAYWLAQQEQWARNFDERLDQFEKTATETTTKFCASFSQLKEANSKQDCKLDYLEVLTETSHKETTDLLEHQTVLMEALLEKTERIEYKLTKEVETLGLKVESLTTQLGALLFKMEEILSQTVKQEEPAYKATHFSFEDDDFMDYDHEDA